MHTTVCLFPECVQALSRLACEKKCSSNDLVKFLLLQEIRKSKRGVARGRCIEYQESTGIPLVLVHIFLDQDLYEACLDLRKFSKRSLSLILSQAIRAAGELERIDNYELFYNICEIEINKFSKYVIIVGVKKKNNKNPG